MKTTAKTGMIAMIDGFVDRAIGVDGLPPVVRQKLLRQQLMSVRQMVPAMTAVMAVVSPILLMLSWGGSQFGALVVTLGVINALQIHAGYLAWRSVLREPPARVDPAARTIIYALLLGALWGVVFNLLPLDMNTGIRGAAAICAGGLLCTAMMALVNYPQALAAFAIPLIGGVLSMADLGAMPGFWMEGALLMTFAAIMAVVTFTHAAGFAAHRASELLLEDRGEIIELLLGEFEQSTSEWIWGFDTDGSINRISRGFSLATGLSEDDLIGADFVHFLQCVTPADDPLMLHLARDIDAHATFQDVELRVTAAGAEWWWSLTGKPAFDEAGTYLGYIGTGSDITERKLAERRITMLAHHDPMTGLLNRNKFTEQLNSCVARLERYGAPFAVMFLDLDQFKSINDSRGHIAGDRLLVQVAQRINERVREPDLAARLGGDEFAILLPNTGDADGVGRLADALIADIRRPYSLEGDMVGIGVSIGIAMAPHNGTQSDAILRHADLALYRAKAEGRSTYRFFENQMDSEARERRQLEVELRDAVAKGELALHYQPVVATDDEQPVGFEALIRWNHPRRGMLAPASFMPVAELSNLIADIGDWTIEQACIAASSWPAHLTVAVNLSAKHFRLSDIALVVQKALAMSGLAPERLELEITEALLMENLDEVVQRLTALHQIGVTIAMDDFGTGYSSLSHLLKFPFDRIKIDRSFVHASGEDAVARETLKAIAALGRTLKLKITAEGVETEEQVAFLAGIACHQLQGYYFGRPLDPAGLAQYLMARMPDRVEALKARTEHDLAAIAS
tara:strand:+ start:2464 stop:4857 length:2394 start_codon:yes stop_codon:yes gene_type:complete